MNFSDEFTNIDPLEIKKKIANPSIENIFANDASCTEIRNMDGILSSIYKSRTEGNLC